MNPCPCGFYNHPDKECVCNPGSVQRYLNKISGPLLDRIDIHLEVVPVAFENLTLTKSGENSEEIRTRVIKARAVQIERYEKHTGIHCNAQISPSMVQNHCRTGSDGNMLLKNAMNKLGFSARAYDRILKVSRTIADLEGCPDIKSVHIAEAVQYRSLDREIWTAGA